MRPGHVESWRTAYAGIVPEEFLAKRAYAEREPRWRDIRSDPTEEQFVFVVETEKGRIVGFACAGAESSGDSVYQGEISAIYLLEPYQRLGIGRRLFSAVAQELFQRGFRSMLVRVLAANPSLRFYEALGGQKLYEAEAHIDGAAYPDVAYGWKDIQMVATP